MFIRRSATVVLAIVLATASAAPGSAAETAAEPPAGSASRAVRFVDDRRDVPNLRADILDAEAVQFAPGALVLQLRPSQATNPYRHRLWQRGVSQIVWLLDTTRAGPDWNYRVSATAADGRFTASVFGRDGGRVCTARATFPFATSYRVVVPASCVGLVWWLRGRLLWDSRLSSRGPEFIDRIPNGGSTPLWA